ncbi:MAG: gamma-glutamylcyclotransferase, partial [Actinomycetota bacterium]
LADHRLAFTFDSHHWEGGVATVIPAQDSTVWGVAWRLTDTHVATLDAYEGVAQGIYRQVVSPIGLGTQTLDALYYRTLDDTPHPPSITYMEALIRGGDHFGLPDHYLDSLREVRTVAGSD